jgi:hypothetical protein
MKIGKKQFQTLEKLSGDGKVRHCLIKENLIISLYLPEFWNAEFDDESLYYYRTPEYASAEAAFSQSMMLLLDARLVEKQEQEINTGLFNQPTSLCYRITKAGRQELDNMR